jgi:hypothetical protein
LKAEYGIGPLVNAACYELEQAGGTVLVVRADNTVAGSITTGSPSETGSGTCTCTGTPNDRYQIAVEILTAGNLGIASFKYTLDAGPDDTTEEKRNWSNPIQVPSGATYTIPNTGLVLTFGGTAFVAGDLFFFQCTAPSFASADLAAALDALKASTTYFEWVHVIGEITAAIAAVVDTKMTAFRTAKKARFAVLEATDVDMISAVTEDAAPSPDVAISGIPQGSWDMKIAMTVLGALGTAKFKYSTDNGVTYSDEITTTAVTGINILGSTGMTATFSAGPYAGTEWYTWKTWDKCRSLWDAALKVSYAAFTSNQVMVCAGFGECVLSDGSIRRVPIAWGVSALLGKVGLSTDLGQIIDAGVLPGFLTIVHDEELNPGLDDFGFCVARQWNGLSGIYCNQGRMMALPTSNFKLVQYRRIENEVYRVVDTVLIQLVNKKTMVDATTGFIREDIARSYDALVKKAIEEAVVKPEHASACTVLFRRNENILSTSLLTVDWTVTGPAYVKSLVGNSSMGNPALLVV